MSDSNAKQNAPTAAQQASSGFGQRAGFVAAVGAVVMVGPARPPGESNVNAAVARQTNQAFEAPVGGEA